jgi:hypothetical protein
MIGDAATTGKIASLVEQLTNLTTSGALHWDRQIGSAHRYARWKDNLLILGPAEPLDSNVPRYLFITPFDSPACVEVNSNDPELGEAVMRLVSKVEEASKQEPPTDPFAITDEVLARLT